MPAINKILSTISHLCQLFPAKKIERPCRTSLPFEDSPLRNIFRLVDEFRAFGQNPPGLSLARLGHKVRCALTGLVLHVPGAVPTELFR